MKRHPRSQASQKCRRAAAPGRCRLHLETNKRTEQKSKTCLNVYSSSRAVVLVLVLVVVGKFVDFF